MPAKSKDATQIIQHIVERFLNPAMGYKPEDFQSISEIMDLPLYALKNVAMEDAGLYETVFKLQSIREFSKLDPEHPFNYLLPPQMDTDIEKHLEKCEAILKEAKEQIPDHEKLRTSILIASMIAHAWEKRTDYLNKKDTKVITIGLDNAGKTAILSMLGGKLGIDSLTNLKATKRVERRKISTDTLDLFIWDFGGQEDYRKAYLETPEKFFLRTDLMIYVIDMQDPKRFQLSFDYFAEILDIMQRLSENPYILCFLHKADPDLINDPDFEVALEFVKEKIKTLMLGRPFEFDMYVTSIYAFFSNEPKFSKYIKDVLKDQQSLTDPMLRKVEGLSDVLSTTLNAVMNLANSVGEQLSKMEYRLEQMEQTVGKIQYDMQYTDLPKPAKAHQEMPGGAQYKPIQLQINPAIKEIESKAIESHRNLEEIQGISVGIPAKKKISKASKSIAPSAPAPAEVKEDPARKKEETRNAILQDLQGLFQRAKTLKK